MSLLMIVIIYRAVGHLDTRMSPHAHTRIVNA